MSFITLHVGAGTFLPFKAENIEHHKMHSEWGEITKTAAEEINYTKGRGGRIIAVGTTVLRLLESAVNKSGSLMPFEGETDIFIKPGYKLKISDGLITNFHLPNSTLLILVSALIGKKRTRIMYDHAIKQRYRFFSYGDASLLLL